MPKRKGTAKTEKVSAAHRKKTTGGGAEETDDPEVSSVALEFHTALRVALSFSAPSWLDRVRSFVAQAMAEAEQADEPASQPDYGMHSNHDETTSHVSRGPANARLGRERGG
jgi:hypothetical protein